MPDLITAIDVSSHQDADLSSVFAQIPSVHVDHVIVKVYLPQELGGGGGVHTIAQAESARAHGCTVGGYVWCYRDLDPAQTIRDAKAMGELAGIEFSQENPLWLDIETYTDDTIPGLQWISAARAEAYRLGIPIGIYTSREMWRRATGDPYTPVFAELPLWAAQYTPPTPEIDDYAPFGGWASCQGRQWTSTPIDQNVFRSADTMTQPQIDEINRVKGMFQSWATNMAARSAQAESWGYDIKDDLSARMAAELQGAVDGLDWVLQQG